MQYNDRWSVTRKVMGGRWLTWKPLVKEASSLLLFYNLGPNGNKISLVVSFPFICMCILTYGWIYWFCHCKTGSSSFKNIESIFSFWKRSIVDLVVFQSSIVVSLVGSAHNAIMVRKKVAWLVTLWYRRWYMPISCLLGVFWPTTLGTFNILFFLPGKKKIFLDILQWIILNQLVFLIALGKAWDISLCTLKIYWELLLHYLFAIEIQTHNSSCKATRIKIWL